jgi:hypothetical protein
MMRTLPRQERVARWVLISIAIALASWGLFEFIHDDYRPPNEPTDPYGIEAKRVAHSIKLPDSVPTASYYPWWLGQDRYFEFLCKHEAGEWVFKTVDNVEGVFQMRPREKATTEEFESRFAMEDPYGYTDWEARHVATLFVGPPRAIFHYLESTLPPSRTLWRFDRPLVHSQGTYWTYYGYVGTQDKKSPMQVEGVDRRRSRYGFTWRGIRRPHDRELGIAGGELIVVDLDTNEVLGIRRGFVRTGRVRNVPGGVHWEFAPGCMILHRPSDGKLVSKDIDFVYWFVSKVLLPKRERLNTGG